jgi:hypothetical protein
MKFVPDEDEHEDRFGRCQCDEEEDLDGNNCTYRPKIYWAEHKRCYYAYEQVIYLKTLMILRNQTSNSVVMLQI